LSSTLTPGLLGRGGMKTIIPAGPSAVEAARTLGTAKRRAGVFPYQWLFPGPNSRHVLTKHSIDMSTTAYGTASDLSNVYLVPEGMRFSLRGVLVSSTVSDFEQASGNLLFTLRVEKVGARNVDGLTNIDTYLGSINDPWPILGRLEFNSLERLIWSVTPVAVITLAGFAFAKLVGHTYPDAEAGEG